jgi:hypothetical protein
LRADINGDHIVDLQDLAILASEWMECDMSLGPELVVNGGFDTDTDWDYTDEPFGGWTISGGKINFADPVMNSPCSQSDVVEIGKTYQVEFTLSGSNFSGAGGCAVSINSDVKTKRTTDGTFTEIVEAAETKVSLQALPPDEFPEGNSFSIDNVSVREVLEGGGFPMAFVFEDYWDE